MEAITLPEQIIESTTPTIMIESTEKPTEATDELTDKTPENQVTNNSETAQKDIAIILIASVGVIALIIILIIALRKRK